MLNAFSEQLHQIIALSENILLWLSNELEQKENDNNNDNNSDNDELNNEELLEWHLERDRLIKLTFNEQQAENYSLHLPLINKMIALDNKLTKQASQNKATLKTSIINIKKNQKASNAYKKY